MHCHNKFFITLVILTLIGAVKVQDLSPTTTSSTEPNELLTNTKLNSTVELTTIPNDYLTTEPSSNQTGEHTQDTLKSTSIADSSITASPSELDSSATSPNAATSDSSSVLLNFSTTTETVTDSDQDKKKDDQQQSRSCFFYEVHNSSARLTVEPNASNLCLDRFHLNLNLTKHDLDSNYTLSDYKDEDNILKVKLEPDSSNSFILKLYWIQLNTTVHKPTDNYGVILTIYEDLELIGKVFVTDKLALNRTKEIEFRNLDNFNNSTYSIGLSKVAYFQIDLQTFLDKAHPESYLLDLDFYLIKNVYQSMQSNKQPEPLQQSPLNSNSQIIIYTIASFLLLAVVIALLYYRRDKFKSLINQHLDTMPRHQNSKYVRKQNSPAINISNYEHSSSFNENPFEQRFLENTAQLKQSDRAGGFSYRNNYNRDKLSLNKSSIGRVFEQSVATIKKRTALKSVSASAVVEFDLKKMDSKYSQSIPLIEFLPLLNELNKPQSQRLFNEFIQLGLSSNGFNTLKRSSKAARVSKNLQKNKDGYILPYDHSRVVLEMNRFLTSDYINASYVPGCNSPKEYIACQCPLKSTTYSFWLMCVQQNVKYIVMTTPLIDSFTTMEKYWPDLFVEDGESLKQIENISIKLIGKRKFNDYTVRTFEVKMNDECKLIKHFQLTEWNQIENAQNVTMVSEFLKIFRDEIGFAEPNYNHNLIESPIVVHCSNGVGKTAVLIAVDRIFMQLRKRQNDYIDIFGTVIEMRQYRPSMIQNEAQYKFIYECVGDLVRKLYPSLVKQMEFDKTLDEINLKDTTDFDSNNNLDSSNNSQLFLIRKQQNGKSPGARLNGYTNQTFVSNEEKS